VITRSGFGRPCSTRIIVTEPAVVSPVGVNEIGSERLRSLARSRLSGFGADAPEKTAPAAVPEPRGMKMAESDEYFQSHVSPEDWGKTIEPGERDGFPVVFHFRPKQFVAVSEDRLKEWEEMTKLEVGLVPDRTSRMWSGNPCETISGSNGDWDDCDCW
jgi:hypothetical protein